MLLASAVVVWEWLNEHGRWRPYSPAVCHHIEAVIRSDPRCGSVVLGQVDLRLSPYIIDLHSMHQFRQDTGEQQSGEVEQCGWACFHCLFMPFTMVEVGASVEIFAALWRILVKKMVFYNI